MGCASSLASQIPGRKVQTPTKTSQTQQNQPQMATYNSNPQYQQQPSYQTPQYQAQPSGYSQQPTQYSQQPPQYNQSNSVDTSQIKPILHQKSTLKINKADPLREKCNGLQKQFISWLNSNLNVNFDALNAIDTSKTSYRGDCFDAAYFLGDFGYGDYTRFDQVKHPKFFEKAACQLQLGDTYKILSAAFDEALYFEVKVMESKDIYKKIFLEGQPLNDYITLTLIVDDYVKAIKALSKFLSSKDLAFWLEPTVLGPHNFPSIYVVKLPSKQEDNKLMPIKIELLDYRSFFLIQELKLKHAASNIEQTKQLYARNKWNWKATVESLYDHSFIDEETYNTCMLGLPDVEDEESEVAQKQFSSFQMLTFHPRYSDGITKQSTTDNVKDMGKSLFNSVKNPLKSLTPVLDTVGNITKIKALGYNPNKLKGLNAFQPRMLEDHEVYEKSQMLIKSQQKFTTNYYAENNKTIFSSAEIKSRCLNLNFFMQENPNEYQELLKGDYFKKWKEHFRIDYALETLYNFITKQANNCLVKLDVKSDHGAIGKVFLRSKALNDFGRATVVSNNPKVDILKLGEYLLKGNEFGFWYEDGSTVQDYPVIKIYIYYKANAGEINAFPFLKILPVEIQFITPDLYFYYKNTDFHDNYELYRCLELKKNVYEKFPRTFQEVTGELINAGLMDIKETFGKQPGYFKEKPLNNSEYVSKFASAARDYDKYGIFNYSYGTQKMAYASQFKQWECFNTASLADGKTEIVKSNLNGLGTECVNGFLFFNFLNNVHPLEFKTSMAIRMEIFLAMGFFLTFTSKNDSSFHYVLTITKEHVSWKKTNSKAAYFSSDTGVSNSALEKDYEVKTYKPSHKKLHIHTIWIYFDRNDHIQIKIDDRLITFDITWPKNTEKMDLIFRPVIKNTALKSICFYDERVASGAATKYVVAGSPTKK